MCGSRVLLFHSCSSVSNALQDETSCLQKHLAVCSIVTSRPCSSQVNGITSRLRSVFVPVALLSMVVGSKPTMCRCMAPGLYAARPGCTPRRRSAGRWSTAAARSCCRRSTRRPSRCRNTMYDAAQQCCSNRRQQSCGSSSAQRRRMLVPLDEQAARAGERCAAARHWPSLSHQLSVCRQAASTDFTRSPLRQDWSHCCSSRIQWSSLS